MHKLLGRAVQLHGSRNSRVEFCSCALAVFDRASVLSGELRMSSRAFKHTKAGPFKSLESAPTAESQDPMSNQATLWKQLLYLEHTTKGH